jgi:TusA-related sulfurtransferase
MRAVTSLHVGDILEVLAEGPGSPAAFARWADRAGHELLGVERATDATGRPAIRLLIRKGVVA